MSQETMNPNEPKAFRDGIQFGWDSTSIKLAEECLRKYYYKMIEGWQPRSKSVHLEFGGWYATALEHFHKLRAQGSTFDEALSSVVYEAIVSSWNHERDEEGNRIPDTGSPWAPDEGATGSAKLKTRENLVRTIIWYLEQFKDDPAKTVILANGKAAVEMSFILPVDNGIMFSGHFDRFVEYMNALYVQDQKTTGTTITPRFFEGYQNDTQMSMYTFAGKMIYNLPVSGIMVDGAQIAVGFSRFERGFVFRTEASLEEWYDDTMYHIQRAQVATKEQHFPMNHTACGNYGGCEFRHVCARTPQVREQFLKADFERGLRWDPLKAR